MVSGDPKQRPIREVAITADGGGIAASIIELGAAIRDLVVKTADGRMQRVVLGLASVDDYFTYSPHMGAICGRFANRIRHGRFTLDGKSYQLPLNQDGRHTLHGGGPTGFGKSRWTLLHADANSATLAIHSPAGHNGFPGAVTATCRYSLVDPANSSHRAVGRQRCSHDRQSLPSLLLQSGRQSGHSRPHPRNASRLFHADRCRSHSGRAG